jgi:hypothetical protein
MEPFSDPDLLTKKAAELCGSFVVGDGTILVNIVYWNRLMALRHWAREQMGLEMEDAK